MRNFLSDDRGAVLNRALLAMALIGLGLASMSNLVAAANVNIVQDGGFETPVENGGGFQTFTGGSTMGPWHVTGNSVDLVTGSFLTAHGGQQDVDLSGTNYNGDSAGGIYQDVATLSGQSYTLTYEESGNNQGTPPIKSLTVSFGGKVLGTTTYNTASSAGYVEHSFDVVATSSTSRLAFVSNVSSVYGPLLDDVTLVASGPGSGQGSGSNSGGGSSGGSGKIDFHGTAKFGSNFTGPLQLSGALLPSNASSLKASLAWGDGTISPVTLKTNNGEVSIISTGHTYFVPGVQKATLTLGSGTSQTAFDGTIDVDSTYVAMGDSYSSGEGAAPFTMLPGCDWPMFVDPSGSPHDTDSLSNTSGVPVYGILSSDSEVDCIEAPGLSHSGDICHRSVSAYPHDLMKLLDITDMTLDFVACSGADADSAYVVPSDKTHQGEYPQLSAVNANTSLVTLSFGGDDLDFTDTVTGCVTPGHTEFDCLHAEVESLDLLGYINAPGQVNDSGYQPIVDLEDPVIGPANSQGSLSGLYSEDKAIDVQSRLVLLLHAIKHLAPGARIIVMGYPRWYPVNGTGTSTQHFSQFEQLWINSREQLVDEVIQDAVNESGVAEYATGSYNALNGHTFEQGDPNWSYDTGSNTLTCSGEICRDIVNS